MLQLLRTAFVALAATPASAAAFLALASAPVSAAAADEIPFRVQIAFAPSCPSPARFVDEVEARSRRARRAPAGQPAASFRVQIDDTPGVGASGTLTAEGQGSEPRQVRGATCDEVASALALTLALTLDPDASSEPLPSAGPAGGLGVVGGAELLGHTAPVPLLGISVAVEHRRAPDAPSFRLALKVVGDGAISSLEGARLVLGTLSLQACPLRWGGASFGLRPCLAAEGGVLVARGRDVDQKSTATAPWVDGVLSLRAEMVPGPLSLEAEGGLVVAATRVKLTASPPERVVAATRWLGYVVALRAAYRFP